MSDNDVKNYIYEINSSPKEMKKFLNDFIKYFDKQRKLANIVIICSTPIIVGIYVLLNLFSEYINISYNLTIFSIIFGLIMLIAILFNFIYPMYVNDNLVLKIINNYLEDILIDEADYRRTKIGFR